MDKTLSQEVTISRQFLRSIRIDTDINDPDVLEGYICQEPAFKALDTMAKHLLETKQRAFTWTGPYGGGKSSLALLLSSLVSQQHRDHAIATLGIKKSHHVVKAFDSSQQSWNVIPIVGSQNSVVSIIANKLNIDRKKAELVKEEPKAVIQELARLAEVNVSAGILLIIDELGKFLESSSLAGDDIFFYQELAELASRCNGKLVIVGILHQAFEQYAKRLGRDVQNEWAKVQGRYVDIPLIAASDEAIELLGKAISISGKVKKTINLEWTKVIANSIQNRRPGTPPNLKNNLTKCWPLHPIVAALLGPVSKRQFSQNERSTFGFLASSEPLGFTDFLKHNNIKDRPVYLPEMYWDYLLFNLDLSIMASPDGHRWAIAKDAVERAEARGTHIHVSLSKTIALIDLFRNGSGLSAEEEVLFNFLPEKTNEQVNKALNDLAKWSIIIFRKHNNAWAIFAGSDFDIDVAISKSLENITGIDTNVFTNLGTLFPIVAKRHYYRTGAMRWITQEIVELDDLKQSVSKLSNDQGVCGHLVLVLTNNDVSQTDILKTAKKLLHQDRDIPVFIGIPTQTKNIIELGLEMSAIEQVIKRSLELEGDLVARREIYNRQSIVAGLLEEELGNIFNFATWYEKGSKKISFSNKGLPVLASNIADKVFKYSPNIQSELLNREFISTNTTKARKILMRRLLTSSDKKLLGFEGYPMEVGLYKTTLESMGIHLNNGTNWDLAAPQEGITTASNSLIPVWEEMDSILSIDKKMTSLHEVYEVLGKPPFGIKSGLLPIFTLTYFLINQHKLSLYIDGMYTPEVKEIHIDEWLQDPSRLKFRYIEVEEEKEELLQQLSKALSGYTGVNVDASSLESARALVALIYKLTDWTKQTTSISAQSKKLCNTLLHASDPHQVIFNDLPDIFNLTGKELVSAVADAIQELQQSYPSMLNSLCDVLFDSFDHHSDGVDKLNDRAKAIKAHSGEFILEAFVNRLESFSGTQEDIESLLSLTINKPPAIWNDNDVKAATIRLNELGLDFRKVEALAMTKSNNRRAMAVVFSRGNGHSLSKTIDVKVNDEKVDALVCDILQHYQQKEFSDHVLLAAITELGAKLLSSGE